MTRFETFLIGPENNDQTCDHVIDNEKFLATIFVYLSWETETRGLFVNINVRRACRNHQKGPFFIDMTHMMIICHFRANLVLLYKTVKMLKVYRIYRFTKTFHSMNLSL